MNQALESSRCAGELNSHSGEEDWFGFFLFFFFL